MRSLDKLPLKVWLGINSKILLFTPNYSVAKDAFELTVQCQIASLELQRKY